MRRGPGLGDGSPLVKGFVSPGGRCEDFPQGERRHPEVGGRLSQDSDIRLHFRQVSLPRAWRSCPHGSQIKRSWNLGYHVQGTGEMWTDLRGICVETFTDICVYR